MILEPISSNDDFHVAIIMDGNGRWALERSLERIYGHHKGAERVHEIVNSCLDNGISHLTIYAFSTENWKRSKKEVAALMNLFSRYMKTQAQKLVTNNVAVRFLGDRSILQPSLVHMMNALEESTRNNTRLHFTIALNYGGRDEIIRAIHKIAAKVKLENLNPDEIDHDLVSAHLDTAGLPDPDLIIRTSGEYRTSNFLPWQSIYSEYIFESTKWPDFTREKFESIIEKARERERRYGGAVL